VDAASSQPFNPLRPGIAWDVAFTNRHLQSRNEVLGNDFGKSQSDYSFLLLLVQLDWPGVERLLREWMAG